MGECPHCLYLYRLLQHSGFYPDYTDEASALALGRPNVENVTLLLKEWWGSGIVHAKVWISDSRDVYIGSANNDWKSLTQVLQFCNTKSCSMINDNLDECWLIELVLGERSWGLSCWLSKNCREGGDLLQQLVETSPSQLLSSHKTRVRSSMADC